MSQIGRALEAPRPLKSTIKQQSLPIYQQNIEITSIEDLIAITEAVAMSLNQGDVSIELFNKMFQSLVMHGQQLEIYSKEILDRCFNVFRNASQDDRLKISIRLNLLNLIELRANSWVGNKCADYYKSKAQSESDIELTLLSSSPSIGANAAFGQSLGPGEVVKNSGKFTKPTKIPGKNYSKDEIIIRNCDSGKVNAGAKERLVQITGPHEDNINYAKNLIEDTIKRNASPIRDTQQEGSMSSLASSDDQQMSGMRSRGGVQMSQNPNVPQLPMTNKLSRSNSHHNAANYLTHSASANDASLGEYKYTVNVGIHSLKITGDSLDLVKVAKLVLDDFFTNDEFLKSHEAILMNSDMGIVPAAHQLPSQPSPFIDSGVHLDLLSRSASGLNVVAQQITNDLDDEVFMHPDSPPVNNNENVLTSSSSIESSSSSNTVVSEQTSSILPSSGLARSRRSHFSRKDSTPETTKTTAKGDVDQRITYSVKSLWWFCKNSSLCKCTPSNMDKIRKECPFIVREKQGDSNSNIVHYYDVDKYMELREKMDKRYTELKNDDIIEIDDED
ncbi:eukaryotic translation initiation factor 4E-binding protein Mextli isoform X2 [Chironomus tepperi]|uniref:eukaryotic translation initiation factor 4E-binding protein Mextli isoform X2 n=1 Tax=Chironomus tepperi TaxID=113505 RepID=UPI00391EF267